MSRKLHDLNIQPGSTDSKRLKAFVEKAEALENDIVAFTINYRGGESIEDLKESISDIESDLEIFPGMKIEVDDIKKMKDALSAVRGEVPVVSVAGGDPEINRAAAGDPRVDLIAHPGKGRKDCGIDHVIAKKAAENRVALENNFRLLLENQGKHRTYQLRKLQKYVRFNEKFGTPVVTNSGAREPGQLRNPRDMSAVLQGLGMEKGGALETVDQNPSYILERFEERQEEGFVRPGIEKEVNENES